MIRNTPNLREKFDVLIFPPVGGNAQTIVNGMPRRGEPIPWKASALTPNMGMSPDQTDDMRGGMGAVGVANLQKFIEEGGLFITIGSSVSADSDRIRHHDGRHDSTSRKLQARVDLQRTFSDRKSPIAYGYDAGLPIYFSQAPLFQVAAGGGGFGGGGGGGGGGRRWRRFSHALQDVAALAIRTSSRRCRSRDRQRQRSRWEHADQRESPFYVPPALRPRVVLRFVSDEKNLLISGMLAGGNELANRPAVVTFRSDVVTW